jgi:enediyne biosynthesis thioesterase
MRSYEYRHRVSLEETNVVGNVYYVHHLRWQGRCRELFLRDHAPQLLQDFRQGLTLATTRVSCAYHQELSAFDEVAVRMHASAMTPSRLTMHFEYVRVLPGGGEELVAEGEQEITCVQRDGARLEPARLPDSLRDAVERFTRGSGATAAASLEPRS